MAAQQTVPTELIFSALKYENSTLALNRAHFQQACRKLELANGAGDGVRRLLYKTLVRVVGAGKNGKSQ